MTVLINGAEGGTNGTGATPANTGGASGNAADAITTSATCTVTFDNTHAAHGGLSYKMLYGATAGNIAFDWSTSMGTQPTIFFRLYLYLTADPPINLRFWGCKAATACANLVINNAGKLVFFNAAGTTLITSTNTVPLNAWFRVEGFVVGSATAGQVEFRLFDAPDSIFPTEVKTSSATANTNTSPTTYIFGNEGVTNSSYTYWQDDLGLSSTGYLGPAVLPPITLTLRGPAAVRPGRLTSFQVNPPAVVVPSHPAPFFAPHTLFRGLAAAVKGKLTSARGRAGVPSPFRRPGPLHGQPAARKGTLTGARGRPGVPAPFTPPARLAPPPVFARPGRLTGARGRAGVPAPFQLPRTLLHGQPAARKGTLAGIVAPPPVVQPNVPAPFFAPHTLLRGQAGIMARTRTAYTAAPPPAPPPQALATWQGSTHIVAAGTSGNLIQGARHVGKGGPGPDLKGDYERSGD